MAYAIVTRDRADRAHLRVECRADHIAFLERHLDKLLAAGAQLDDAGVNGHGGIVILDTDDRAEAERFVAEDPYTKAGLFEEVTVTRWRKAFLAGKKLI